MEQTQVITQKAPTLDELRAKMYATQGVQKPRPIGKLIRKNPHLYNAMRQVRFKLSKYVANSTRVWQYQTSQELFRPNAFEAQHVAELRKNGITILEGFIDEAVIDRIEAKADTLFRNLDIQKENTYSVFNKLLPSLDGFTYDEIRTFESVISLRDPLLAIPEIADVTFHETIMKITANYFGYVPREKSLVVLRNFPHAEPLHASNFHIDSDYDEVIQVFVYLVDVDGRRGPFLFIPGSHGNDARPCMPRSNADLGLGANYLRHSDEEVAKYYPRSQWVPIKAKRGSVVIAHTNGFHKGPVWDEFGHPDNQFRDLINFTQRSTSVGVVKHDLKRLLGTGPGERPSFKLHRRDFERLTPLQRLAVQEAEIV